MKKKYSIEYREETYGIHYDVISPYGVTIMGGINKELALPELKALHEKTILRRLNTPMGQRY